MPQLDPTYFAAQIFWLAITFTALYFILSNFVLPKLEAVKAERSNKIESDLKAAEIMKNDAEDVLGGCDGVLNDSRNTARSELAKELQKINAETAKQHSEVQDATDRIVMEAQTRIEDAKEGAKDQIRTVAADITGEIMEKIIGSKPDTKAVTSGVEAVMARKERDEEAA